MWNRGKGRRASSLQFDESTYNEKRPGRIMKLYLLVARKYHDYLLSHPFPVKLVLK
jgi:hypothetical protein